MKSLHDLKGKKIATTFSSTAHYSLLSALKIKTLILKRQYHPIRHAVSRYFSRLESR
ncbi:hypothetical protein AAAC51_13895 [Priestia megaterium]